MNTKTAKILPNLPSTMKQKEKKLERFGRWIKRLFKRKKSNKTNKISPLPEIIIASEPSASEEPDNEVSRTLMRISPSASRRSLSNLDIARVPPPAPKPDNEAERLLKLGAIKLDKQSDDNFDRVVILAEKIFKTEIVLVSIVDDTTQWFKSSYGLTATSTCRDIAFCAHAILQPDYEPFVVMDAREDERFKHNPFVTGEPYIRFYAGAPLRTADGYNLGTICIIDSHTRTFTAEDGAILKSLASVVIRELDLICERNESAVLHANQIAITSFAQQAPFFENVRMILDFACDMISKTLSFETVFLVEIESPQSRSCVVRSAVGLEALTARLSEDNDKSEASKQRTGRSASLTSQLKVPSKSPMSKLKKRRPSNLEFGSTRALTLIDDIMTSLSASAVSLNGPLESVPKSEGLGRFSELLQEEFPVCEEVPASTLRDLLYPGSRGYAVTVPIDDLHNVTPFNFRDFQLGEDDQHEAGDRRSTPSGEICLRKGDSFESSGFLVLGAFTKNGRMMMGSHVINCLISLATALASAISHHKTEVALRASEEGFRKEQELLSALINNILPPLYADRLKSRQEAIADRHQNCSIIFADIVGFTTLSSNMDANELVTLLNKIFMRFDLLSQILKVEKIKTIGDCYMAGTGVPAIQPDHAEIMAEFGLALIASLKRVNESLNINLAIRIGINSGPLVAGVIGLSKFQYDIWGNTVNIAQRMEAGSEPGRINVGESTYNLLKHKYRFTERGICKVKGAGPLNMYFLDGRIEEQRDEAGLLPEEAVLELVEQDVTETMSAMFNHDKKKQNFSSSYFNLSLN